MTPDLACSSQEGDDPGSLTDRDPDPLSDRDPGAALGSWVVEAAFTEENHLAYPG
ncbi:hypothetical protein GJ633_06120 [Halorubrum sp. CBA1125]|uniref:hypothetical protein n=1 Tax=Halorubrum sp. CBA1125 TaxID=2668072 RepID=UPI0012E7BBB3|nr:hypothetical protein [Halorubrum sp. CBA1125]MUW14282.1 hypothetical protein [Halorubrum sp. CBA1125]